MKRVLAFASALALAVGAIAPAAFADDLPVVPSNSEPVSIWNTSTTSVENPYNTQDLFDWCNNAWGDLFDDGRLNNYTVTDFQRDDVAFFVSKYVAAHEDEEINGVVTSYFDDIVDYVCAHPTDFDLYWDFAVNTWWMDGIIYGQILPGENFFENLKEYVLANYYTTPASTQIEINGHIWVSLPCSWYNRYTYNALYIAQDNRVNQHTADVWVTRASNYAVICTFIPYVSGQWYVFSSEGWCSRFNNSYDYNGVTVLWGQGTSNSYPSGLDMQYSDLWAARNDFYGYYNEHTGGGVPVSNGKVYLRETPIGGDNLNFSFPAAPVSNSKAVSNYYYNTYGDEWEDSSTVINETVYNNNTTTLYPVTYDNNIPIWLVSPTTSITTYNYSLDLPSADLEELPNEFEGGGDFFQDSFLALGGFGSFVLIAFSFGLVALFFKG